jgi:hypothetical protein
VKLLVFKKVGFMRPGRPIQLTLSIAHNAAAADRVVSLVDANNTVLADLHNGVVNIPKHKLVTNALPAAQAQNLAGPNWNGNPMLTGRTYDSPRSGGRTRSISIRNMHTADDLQVSFDRGVNFFTLAFGESFSDEVSLQFFQVRRSTSTADPMLVEILAILV